MSRLPAVLLALALPAAGLLAAAERKPDLAEVERLVVSQTNAFRKAEGRAAVERDATLDRAADDFAKFMARTGEYGHEADGSTPAARAERAGYAYCFVGENISYQYNSQGFATADLARQYVEGWKGSPGHRRNMLEAGVTHTGVAVARSAKTGYYYAVQMFGRPKSARIEFRVENGSRATVGYRVGGARHELRPRVVRTHTECRVDEIVFVLPGRGDGGPAFTPRAGDRFVVEDQARDGLAVRRR